MKTPFNKSLLVTACMAIGLAIPAQARVIFQDDFAGDSTTELETPWTQTEAAKLKANGFFSIGGDGAGQFAAYSGVTMGAGGKWLISAEITQTKRTDGWAGLGLALDAHPDIWKLANNSILSSGELVYQTPWGNPSSECHYLSGGTPLNDGETVTYAIQVDNTGTDTVLSYFKDGILLSSWTNTGHGILTYGSQGLIGYTPGAVSGKYKKFTIETVEKK